MIANREIGLSHIASIDFEEFGDQLRVRLTDASESWHSLFHKRRSSHHRRDWLPESSAANGYALKNSEFPESTLRLKESISTDRGRHVRVYSNIGTHASGGLDSGHRIVSCPQNARWR